MTASAQYFEVLHLIFHFHCELILYFYFTIPIGISSFSFTISKYLISKKYKKRESRGNRDNEMFYLIIQ